MSSYIDSEIRQTYSQVEGFKNSYVMGKLY